MKHVYLLGACGSIGVQTLDIIRNNKSEFKVIGLSVGRDLELSKRIFDEFRPEIVCFRYQEHIEMFNNYDFIKCYGDDGLEEVAKYSKYENEILVNALVGSVGLIPTIEGIKSRKTIALANKESLVMAGDIINKLLDEYKVKLHPIDSEHSAIWQCIQGDDINDINSLIITASGGSFRDKPKAELENVTVKEALAHPNWSMGAKITVDSATMMNKGFEVIEAHHLFGLPYDKIKTIMHRESIIHSMVEYNDMSIKAQMGNPDMRIPIQYALLYPKHNKYDTKPLDLVSVGKLSFEEIDIEKYRCLAFAYECAKKGGLYPVVLNASNEASVKLFLDGKIKFLDIEKIIEKEIKKEYTNLNPTITEILDLNYEIQQRILNDYVGD